MYNQGQIQNLELFYQIESGKVNSQLFIKSLNTTKTQIGKHLSFFPNQIKPVIDLYECLDLAYFTLMVQLLENHKLLKHNSIPEIIKEGKTIYIALSSIKQGTSTGFISPDSMIVKDGKTYVSTTFLFNYYPLPEPNTPTFATEKPQRERPKQPKQPIKTYLLKDTATNTIKFGASMRPHHRESTLHAEKPTMQLMAVCAGKIDHVLKKQYKHLHVRGEWYLLSQSELSEILSQYHFITIAY